MQQSVFDMSARLFCISGRKEISAIKLQKLMYYAYGWYGRLTGKPLFEQHFYAMRYGPVVGELLTLHSAQKTISPDLIEVGRSALEDVPLETDVYIEQLLSAVWEYYGDIDPWKLVEMTHKESPWMNAWSARLEDTRRAVLDGQDIIEFFLYRSDIDSGFAALLPPAQVTPITVEDMHVLESFDATAGEHARDIFVQRGLIAA